MPQTNMRQKVSLVNSVDPDNAYTTDQTGDGVDTRDYNSVLALLVVTLAADTLSSTDKITFTVQDSDDDGATDTYATVAAAHLDPGALTALTANSQTPGSYTVALHGCKRYVRWFCDFAGTHSTGQGIWAGFLLGDPSDAPTDSQTL